MHKTQDKFKIKKRIRINSLEAAICNVALFKSMKDKDFRDTIFISYCEQGVILQALNQSQWKKAHQHIQSFLQNKKIELLIDGYDKDAYQALINKGLKQITRKIRQSEQQCPYINIIHYQKLRKSCQYMHKQLYVEPLKDWQKKFKKNPNFAFLIVQPKYKFDQIKRNLLQYLLNQQIPLKITNIQPLQLMHLLFYSPNKQVIKTNCNRRQIQVSVQRQQQEQVQMIKATNFTNLNLNEYDFSIIKSQNKITKSGMGLQAILAIDIKNQVKNAKIYCKDNPTDIIQAALQQIQKQYGENFVIIPYRHQQKQKYKNLIQKYTNAKFTKQQIQKKLQFHQIFSFQQIQFIDQISTTKKYKCWKVCINSCPFMIHQYLANTIDIDSFLIYLDQLQLFYCTYLVRYYGVIVKRPRIKDNSSNNQPISYLLVFDYHRSNLLDMMQNDMIVDSMQIATIVLQLLYLINFLHSHQQPRCLGSIQTGQIFWPMATVLPYLGLNDNQQIYSIQNDIRQAGLLMQQLLGEQQDQQCLQMICKMTNSSKSQRIQVKKSIAQLEDMLCL